MAPKTRPKWSILRLQDATYPKLAEKQARQKDTKHPEYQGRQKHTRHQHAGAPKASKARQSLNSPKEPETQKNIKNAEGIKNKVHILPQIMKTLQHSLHPKTSEAPSAPKNHSTPNTKKYPSKAP